MNSCFGDPFNSLSVSDEAKNLLQRMFAADPADRITAEDILSHPWVSNRQSLPTEKFIPEYTTSLKKLIAKWFTTPSVKAPTPSLSLGMPVTPGTPTGSKTVQLVCPGFKIPVRSEPNPTAEVLRCLTSGEVVRVLIKSQSGYYQLADKPVSDQFVALYFNL